jgi:DNA-nicking Smr family endonuclease
VRSLSPEESALWQRVASTIRPLSRDKKELQLPVSTDEKPRPAALRASPGTAAAAIARKAPGTTLDGSWDRRLRGGNFDPDRVIDLHGLSLDGAWRAIDAGLDQAIARGERVLLLITGHARSGEPPIRRGAIRAVVHDWLAASRHAGEIAAVRGAHARHGGGGSLYIIFRRPRRLR